MGQETCVTERVIFSDACVAEGAAYLAQLDPRFANALAQTGKLPLRLRADGFSALFDAIVGQQISVAAANAVWDRLEHAGLTDAAAITLSTDEKLRDCGLSGQKIRYARALAAAELDYPGLRQMPSNQVIKVLTKVTGIGPWTAEVYVMFSLGRRDVFAPGDLALQEAAKRLFELDTRPSATQMRSMAEDWSPWRSVAARLLWAYYRVSTEKEGIR